MKSNKCSVEHQELIKHFIKYKIATSLIDCKKAIAAVTADDPSMNGNKRLFKKVQMLGHEE